MAHLQYYNYDGWGQKAKEDFSYSQAVRIGDRIECAGQGMIPLFRRIYLIITSSIGGWDLKNFAVDQDVNTQIDQAFINIDVALKHAGGKGWEQVFRVNSYHVPASDEAMGAMVRNLKKWMPNHQPIWTCAGVVRLATDDMKVEIEVVAHTP